MGRRSANSRSASWCARVTISLLSTGVARSCQDRLSLELMHFADHALHEAKSRLMSACEILDLTMVALAQCRDVLSGVGRSPGSCALLLCTAKPLRPWRGVVV